MPVDLHTHSAVSDGTDPPHLLIEAAVDAGLESVALTDHDTLDGITEARTAAERLDIRFVPGVELSVQHGRFKLHLLVYFTDPGPGPLNDRMAELLTGRGRRNVEIVAKLQDLGYEITMDDVSEHARGPSVGRPHIADALVASGAFPDRDAVFEHLLHDGGPAYVERARLTATDAIDLARRQRAVPVIAHPVTIGASADDYAALFRELTDVGLGGIEAHHPMHPPRLRIHLSELASGLGIAATGGSDYHGTGKRSYHLGRGTGDLCVPMAALDALETQRER